MNKGHTTDWQVAAFAETIRLAEKSGMSELAGSDLGLSHLHDMLLQVQDDANPQHPSDGFNPAKLGRWLGWAQCAVVAAGAMTLDDMKRINRMCSAATSLPSAEAVAPKSAKNKRWPDSAPPAALPMPNATPARDHGKRVKPRPGAPAGGYGGAPNVTDAEVNAAAKAIAGYIAFVDAQRIARAALEAAARVRGGAK